MGSCFQCEYLTLGNLTLGSDSKSSSLLPSSKNIFLGKYNITKLISVFFNLCIQVWWTTITKGRY